MSLQPPPSYRSDIDVMRAFAVLAVIVNHFNKDILPSGFLGVDMFFVISGYVITASLAARNNESLRDLLLSFYSRRIKRLAPALAGLIIPSCVLICLFNPSPLFSLKSGIASLLGVSNLYFLRHATNYFSEAAELNPFTHTWSLGVEEQFYLLFPFICWATNFSKDKVRGAFGLSYLLTILSVISFFLFAKTHYTDPSFSYFSMPTRFWQLSIGCLIQLASGRNNSLETITRKLHPNIYLALILLAMCTAQELLLFSTVFVTFATAGLILGTTEINTSSFFSNSLMIQVGKQSYSLYLWHWFFLVIARWTIGISGLTAIPIVLCMFGVAHLSYIYIEGPLRRNEWAKTQIKTIALGLLLVSLSAAFVIALIKGRHQALFLGVNPQLVAVGVSSLQDTYSIQSPHSQWIGKSCILQNDNDVGKRFDILKCTLGNFNSAKRRVFVAGNSFAPAFVHAFDSLVIEDNFAITITSSWGAAPVIGTQGALGYRKSSDYYWNYLTSDHLKKLSPGDLVFLISDMHDFSPKTTDRTTKESIFSLTTALSNFSKELSSRGIGLVILHGLPFAREANCHPVTATKQWFSPSGGPCKMPDRAASLARRSHLNEALTFLQNDSKLRIVDLFDVFCPSTRCSYFSETGVMLYRDEFSHPSVEAARLSSAIIRKLLLEEGDKLQPVDGRLHR